MIPAMMIAIYGIISAGALAWLILGTDKMYTDIIAGWGAVVGFAITGAYFEADLVYDVVGGAVHPLEAQSVGYMLYACSFISGVILAIKAYQLINNHFDQIDRDNKERSARPFDNDPPEQTGRIVSGIPLQSVIILIVVTSTIVFSGVFLQVIFQTISTEAGSTTGEMQFTVYRILHTYSTALVMILTLIIFAGGFYLLKKSALSKTIQY